MLSGERILITGANGGIGHAISEIFLKNNAKLILFHHEKRELLESLLKSDQKSPSIQMHQVDLLDIEQIDKKINTVLEEGPIDIFIHSVSLPIEIKNLNDLKWQDFESHLELQIKSFFRITQLLLPTMKSNKHGKIISILTSATIGKPPNKMTSYVVAKYALLGLSKALAVELGPYGITVNCISPSMVETSLIQKFPTKLKEIVADQTPLGKLANPSDIAGVALFLSSRYSNHITGENIIVTGGYMMS